MAAYPRGSHHSEVRFLVQFPEPSEGAGGLPGCDEQRGDSDIPLLLMAGGAQSVPVPLNPQVSSIYAGRGCVPSP